MPRVIGRRLFTDGVSRLVVEDDDGRQWVVESIHRCLGPLTRAGSRGWAHGRMEVQQMSDNGLITIASVFSVRETLDRLASTLTSKGLTVFARIDHAGNALKAGMQLRPTEVLIFGNPKAGTPLMQDKQTIGIDLPVKALAWQDASGKVWLTYNAAAWLASRHDLSAVSDSTIKAIEAGLAAVSKAAANAVVIGG
jgi:uncharacterized protein (DUF302 family)